MAAAKYIVAQQRAKDDLLTFKVSQWKRSALKWL